MIDPVLTAIDRSRDAAIRGLSEFLRFPSVSTQPQHKQDVADCAQWLAEQMNAAGLQATVRPTAGHPVVLAQNEHKPGRPTVLVYGHYDVQPAEPLELWQSPAFEPTVRDGAIYARGAADDKGQVWCHVEAIRAWQRHGELPINLTLLIEGEEEIGSGSLGAFIRENQDRLRADVAVISDTSQFARGLPAITYGLRGLVYMEIILTGPNHDLHSGIFGGSVPNPANVMVELLATLHDRNGRITIPGFYDEVESLSESERHLWRELPFDDTEFARSLGLRELSGEIGYTTIERRWSRPTCDINGLTSGYQGQGAKTIVPSTASAKVSMRLVPHQDPAKIQAAFEQALRDRCPKSVSIEFVQHGAAAPVVVPIDSRPMRLAAQALEAGFGTKPTFMREGGSIPVVGLLKSALGLDTLLVGFGLPDDRVHSPNEKFDLDALHKGTRTCAALYQKLAELT